jgi:hypothetical protein
LTVRAWAFSQILFGFLDHHFDVDPVMSPSYAIRYFKLGTSCLMRVVAVVSGHFPANLPSASVDV